MICFLIGILLASSAYAIYTILNSAHRDKVARVWAEKFGGDFDSDMLEHYNSRQQVNFSYDLDLQKYWKERKEKAFWDKK